ncbi:MAG: hypothetical protein KOO63_08405 [Bacteroidales bacterium]|nr:hypothetical protein [Candidatus Latescibacterota bacterium]
MLLRNHSLRKKLMPTFSPFALICIGSSMMLDKFSGSYSMGHFFEGLFLGLGMTVGIFAFIVTLKGAGDE